ncbi:MAG: hypothetical protein AAB431_02140 [Patescibacteria group bacterium]
MLVFIAVCASVILPIANRMPVVMLGRMYQTMILNEALFRQVVGFVQEGHYGKLVQLAARADTPITRHICKMADDRTNPMALHHHTIAYIQAATTWNLRLLFHMFNRRILQLWGITAVVMAGLLLLDGMQSFWVVLPVLISSIFCLKGAEAYVLACGFVAEELEQSIPRMVELAALLKRS